jgi:hypothetical protein
MYSMMKPIAASRETMPLSRSSLPAFALTEPTDGIDSHRSLVRAYHRAPCESLDRARPARSSYVLSSGPTEALNLTGRDVSGAQDVLDL